MNPLEAVPIGDVRPLIIQALHWIAMIIEVVGVGVIVVTAVASTVVFVRNGLTAGWTAGVQAYRADLGRGILLGLEFLVAADIIGTVAITPSFQSLGVLASIITIRTLLSFSLEVEIEGRWPWRRRDAEERNRERRS